MTVVRPSRRLPATFLLICFGMAGLASTGFATTKIMCLGDSITSGDGDHASYRWPLWKLLVGGGYDFDLVGPWTTGGPNQVSNPEAGQVFNGKTFDLDHAGSWGIRSTTIAQLWPWQYLGFHPDILLLHLGTNDVFDAAGNPSWTLNNFSVIINGLRAENPNLVILLAQIVPGAQGTWPQTLDAAIPAYAASLTTPQSPVIVVDQLDGFVNHIYPDLTGQTNDPNGMLSSDGVHPNPTGESWMAQNWLNAMLPYLGGGGGPGTVATPLFTPPAQTFTGSVDVTLTCATASSTIFYTTDGTTPTHSSAVYNTPIHLTMTTTLKALGAASGMNDSNVASTTYTAGASGPTNTYYVSPTGNDASDGHSTATAWKTLAKVNSSAFQPGDQILFQRGGEWRESLLVPSSGASGNPITFGAYGDGSLPKPKFWGSVVLNNANFQSIGNGVYSYPMPTPVYSILANHVFFYDAHGQSASNVPNAWSYGGGTLLINSPGSNPLTDGKVYTAVQRDDVVYSNGKDHLIFQDLAVDESARLDNNGGYAFRIMGSHDVLVENCDAYRAGKHHFGVINSTQFIGKNLYAAYAAPGQNATGGASAYVSYGDSNGPTGQTSEWHNCVWEHPENPQDGGTYYIFFTHGPNMGSVLLDHMTSLGGGWFSVDNQEAPSAVIKIVGGLIENGRLEMEGSNILVDGMELSGSSATVDMAGSNDTIQNMLIHGTNLGSSWYQAAVVSRGANNVVRFSTIVLDPAAPSSNAAIALPNADTHFQFYGNILIAPQRALSLWSGSLNSSSIMQASYNLYAPGATFAETSTVPTWHWIDHPFSQWQGLGFDGGALVGDPGFNNPSGGDYSLKPTALAVDAAALDSSLLTMVPTDFAGHPRLQGSTFDMGAYESSGVSTPPAITVSVTPQSQQIQPSQSVQFTAAVIGTSNQTVQWYLSPNVGTVVNGLYTAPANIPSQQTVTLTAVSVADPTKSGSASLTLLPSSTPPVVQVSLNLTALTLGPSQSQTFSATVTGTSDPSVTWSFSPPLGTLVGGTYTAPASIPNPPPSITVTATSVADPMKSATATVTLANAITPISVAVSPATVILGPGDSRVFSATVVGTGNIGVSWSLSPNVGSITGGTYVAPLTVNATQQVMVTATSSADPTKSGTGTLLLVPVPAVLPPSLAPWPSMQSVNIPLTLVYPGDLTQTTFEWSFTSTTSTTSSTSTALGQIATVAASGLALVPASHGVSAGSYTVSVLAVNSTGRRSTAVRRDIVLTASVMTDSSPRVYPNPWRTDRDQGQQIVFDSLGMNAVVKIFSVSGHLVRTLASSGGSTVWDRTNDHGETVGSGIYLYLVTDGTGAHKRGKLAIVR